MTHFDDPVPRLPPLLFGYRHVSPEYWLNGGTSTTTDYTTSEVTVCTGTANVSCNAGTSGFDTTAHSYYFEEIAACAPDLGFKRDTIQARFTDVQLENLAEMDIQYAQALEAAS